MHNAIFSDSRQSTELNRVPSHGLRNRGRYDRRTGYRRKSYAGFLDDAHGMFDSGHHNHYFSEQSSNLKLETRCNGFIQASYVSLY